jgi:hypothetical protein
MLAPTPGKELEPASLRDAPELNTIAERTDIFTGPRFDFVKNDQRSFPPTRATWEDMCRSSQDLITHGKELTDAAQVVLQLLTWRTSLTSSFTEFVNRSIAFVGTCVQLRSGECANGQRRGDL